MNRFLLREFFANLYALEVRMSQEQGGIFFANRNTTPPVGYPSAAVVRVCGRAQRSGARPDAALEAADGVEHLLLVRRRRGYQRHVRWARAGLGSHPDIGSGNQRL